MMGSNFDVNHLVGHLKNLAADPTKVSGAVSGFVQDHWQVVAVLAAAVLMWTYVSTYRQRRRKERRLTGREGSLKDMEAMRLPRGKRAHESNPALPAVRVRKERTPYKTISSTGDVWWVAGKYYTEPQMVAIAMTGAGKNQTLLDPTAWNILSYREESVVVMDVKGDMIAKFAYRTPGRQFAYSFLESDGTSSAINLIETPKMAAATAAALYPIKGVKVPAFNMGARDLFEALAEALDYSRSNIVELFRYLRKPEAMNELAKTNEHLAEALSGENRKFISDVVSSARLPLSALNRPEVARVFAPDPDTPQPHFLEKETVWVCIPQDSEDVALLAGAIVHNLYNRAVASRRGTYFLVDEAGSTITIEDLAKYLSVGRGLGAYFFLVLQDVSQLQDRIGAAETRSVLGNAGVQFWGKSQDTETARYVCSLSGRVRVSWAIYEDDESQRASKQMFSAEGAPYRMEDRDREGILPEHVHGVPKGWWYAYDGDPRGVELLIPAPMYKWEEKVLPQKAPCTILGIPHSRPPRALPPAAAKEPGELDEDSGRDEEPEGGGAGEISPADRVCAGCERPVSTTARFCENCGGRL